MVKQFHKNNQSSVLRLSQRLEAYQETNSLFEFLVDFSTKSDDEIKETCESLGNIISRTLSLGLKIW